MNRGSEFCGRKPGESGAALVVALIALSLFSLLGLYVTFSATTGLRISDNYEGQVRADYAARAGLNHARALLRGLEFSDVLVGPDGTNSTSAVQSKTFGFRNPVPIESLRSVDIVNPVLGGLSDDGLISTGYYNGIYGTVLIPLSGIAQNAPAPYFPGTMVVSRYFVKISDDNGQPSELAGDPADNPFVDGNGIVLARSIGVATTTSELVGSEVRRNSIATWEARFNRLATYRLAAGLVVEGTRVNANFTGTNFLISGGSLPGIDTIDTDTQDEVYPDQIIRLAAGMNGTITGGGLSAPSIEDITSHVSSNRDQAILLDPSRLWDFVQNRVPEFADGVHIGDQHWNAGTPYAGFYDVDRPWNSPGQDPKVTFVQGNLDVTGAFSGAGLLVVTGDFSYSGGFSFTGLVLVIGSGDFSAAASGQGIVGGLLVANLGSAGGNRSFGVPTVSIGGSSRITANDQAVSMAIRLIPVFRSSLRKITSSLDP